MREGWTYKKLGEVCEVVSGSTPKTNVPEFWGNGHYWITPAEIDDATVYINKTERQITDAAIDKTHLQLLPIGTVLLSSRAPIGKVAITDTEMYCNQGFKNCICSDAIYNKFLFFFLKYKKNYLNSLGRGATFKEISKSIVEKVAIPLPPLSEQQSIVAELDKINELISLKKAQLSDLDALAQSIFYDMFGDPIVNEKGWEVKKWENVFETRTGKLNANAMVEAGAYPFFTCSKDVSYIDTYAFDCEALLLAGNNASAKYDVKYYKGKFNAYQRTYVLTIKEGSYPFFKISLEGKLSFLQTHSLGGLTKYLTMGVLNELSFIFPPLPLQHEFAKRIELIEQQKAQISSTIKDLETLLASRMQYWFD